jgi:hypothetical protein
MLDDPEEFWSEYHVAKSKKRSNKDLTTGISSADYAAKYPDSPGLKFMNRTDLEEAMFPGSAIGDKLRDFKQGIKRSGTGNVALGMMPAAGAGAMAGSTMATTAVGATALFAPALGAGALLGAGAALGGFLTYKGLNWLAQKLFGTKEEALAFADAHLKAAGAGRTQFEFQGKTYPVKIKSHQEAQQLLGKIRYLQTQLDEDTAIDSLRRAAGLTENVLRDSTGSTFDHILDTFKRDVRDFEESGNLSDALYDALYDYYHHDMPYGVQKARSGDPYEWVSDRFGADLGISGYGGSSPGLGNEDYGLERESAGDYAPERAPHSVDGGMNNSILYDDSACNMSEAGEPCPTHGVQECWGAMANEDDEKNSSVMPALAGAAAGGAAGYALGSGALNSIGSSVPSAPISPPLMVEKDMDRMKKLAGVKTTDEGVLGTLGGAALGSTLGAWGAGAGAVLGDKLTDEGIMAPIVGGLGGAALGGEIGKNIGSQFGSDVGTAIGKAAGQEQAGTLGSIVGGLKGGSAGSSAGGQAGAKIGQAVGGVAGLAGGAALDSASNKSKTNETELGTGIGAGIGGALGGLGGAALGGIAGHYYSEKNKGAKETDEGWKGQLAGGTVGTLAGSALGAATPIPGGALIGAALGGTGGQMLGDKLGGQETDEGVRGAIAGGALGGVATKSLKGVTAGAKLGSAIQDRLSKKDDKSPLAGQYGHSGKMQAVDKDTSFLDRLKELSGMKQS